MNCSFARVSRTSLGAVGYAKFESLLNTCPNSGNDSEAFFWSQAQAILGDLPHEDQSSYDILVNALEERFASPSLTELYRVQFRERKKKASESLPELGQVLRRLSNLAYPTAPRQ
jgi:hypothetical protein